VRGSRGKALSASPVTSSIRVRVIVRHACARQPGGKTCSLTPLGPPTVPATAATETGSSSHKRKVVLTLKISVRWSRGVPR